MQRISTTDRNNALETVHKEDSNRIPLILTYHPLILPIRDKILNNFKILQRDPSTSHIFTNPPVVAFRRDRNLASHLVRASHPTSLNPTVTPGTYCCGRKRCNTCDYVTQGSFNHITGQF